MQGRGQGAASRVAGPAEMQGLVMLRQAKRQISAICCGILVLIEVKVALLSRWIIFIIEVSKRDW